MLQSKDEGYSLLLTMARKKKQKNAVDKRVHEIKTEDEEAEGAVVRHDPIRRRSIGHEDGPREGRQT
jgi:hypothetical protein